MRAGRGAPPPLTPGLGSNPVTGPGRNVRGGTEDTGPPPFRPAPLSFRGYRPAPVDATLDAPAHDLVAALRDDATAAGTTDPDALARRLCGELRRLAHGHRVRWRGNDTLDTTALVHEAYLKVARAEVEGDRHFLLVAGRGMRQVLVNYARDRGALKRGGGVPAVPLDGAPPEALLTPAAATDVLGVDRALARLAALDGRAASVVELRFFGGLTLDETAEALGVSEATVTRDWRRARTWLHRELGDAAAA